ncbi:hypothetical protein BTN50_0608 [Candidatus Enterovibrio altilux]|uniref:Uncharacterized protein n=1 Tax=Candidatus Enterovibrio altilux TaxID=1927128 RepID=A0A291B812_9GAMM|nr:hypothetical protein BTN50_0608 [Candidatus Enterovibrio luxaltus]
MLRNHSLEQYNEALLNQASLTFLIDEEFIPYGIKLNKIIIEDLVDLII